MPQSRTMPRPKLEKTKSKPLRLAVYPELHAGLEAIAQKESRSLNQMVDLLLRDVVILKLNAMGETKLAAQIAKLP